MTRKYQTINNMNCTLDFVAMSWIVLDEKVPGRRDSLSIRLFMFWRRCVSWISVGSQSNRVDIWFDWGAQKSSDDLLWCSKSQNQYWHLTNSKIYSNYLMARSFFCDRGRKVPMLSNVSYLFSNSVYRHLLPLVLTIQCDCTLPFIGVPIILQTYPDRWKLNQILTEYLKSTSTHLKSVTLSRKWNHTRL